MPTGHEMRRQRFQEKGYKQVEVWLPGLARKRVEIAKAMRGDRGVNDVIEEAVEEWLDRHGIPKEFPV